MLLSILVGTLGQIGEIKYFISQDKERDYLWPVEHKAAGGGEDHNMP